MIKQFHLTHRWGPIGVSPKVNVRTRQEFEFAYFDVTVWDVSDYAIVSLH